MIEILKNIWEMTFGLVYDFIDQTLIARGYSESHLDGIPIKIGFGQIEWLNLSLADIYNVVTMFILGVIFLLLIWKAFKFFTKLVNRAFGGRKW